MNIKFGQYIEATDWTADKLHFYWKQTTSYYYRKKASLEQHKDDPLSCYLKTDQL